MGKILKPILTIGHSTLEIEKFVALCRQHLVQEIVDIRSHPTSRWEWFRREQMSEWLSEHDIRYVWSPGLGGWDVRHAEDDELRQRMADVGVNLSAYGRGHFPKQRIAAGRVGGTDGDPAWTNQGLYDYAWFTTLPEFQDAAQQLIDWTENRSFQRPAIMCAETLWWKCHRSMVADYLTHVHDHDVFHMQPRLLRHRDALGSRIDRYPAPVRRTWPSKES